MVTRSSSLHPHVHRADPPFPSCRGGLPLRRSKHALGSRRLGLGAEDEASVRLLKARRREASGPWKLSEPLAPVVAGPQATLNPPSAAASNQTLSFPPRSSIETLSSLYSSFPPSSSPVFPPYLPGLVRI